MKKKIPHTVNTEDLLELVEISESLEPVLKKEDENPEIVEYLDDVLPFLSSFNITPGEKSIKKTLLFSIYRAWSINPLKRKDFINKVNQYIPSGHTTNDVSCFKINQNAIKLTHDVYVKYHNEYRKIKSKHWARHFEDFLNYYALTNKDYWIELDILFFLYDKYVYTTDPDRPRQSILNKDHFEKFCNLHLNNKITSVGKIYAVSPNIVNFFQPGQIERMKAENAKSKKEPEKKKNKKKRAKVPRSGSKI